MTARSWQHDARGIPHWSGRMIVAEPGTATTVMAAAHELVFPAAGRNDPCPCGSGRKFKRCCLAREGD